MQPLQGHYIPRKLAWGQLAAGIHILATARVDGVPFSDLQSPQQQKAAAAAAAADKALQQIHSLQPGFLHGDLRLANILLQRGVDDAAPPTAVFIDFAASRLDGTPAEVEAETRQLKSLLHR